MVYSYNGDYIRLSAVRQGFNSLIDRQLNVPSYNAIKTVTANLFVLVRPWSQVRALPYTLRSICSSVGRARIKTVLGKRKRNETKYNIFTNYFFTDLLFMLCCP